MNTSKINYIIKIVLLIIFFFNFNISFAQSNLKIVKANSVKTYFIEDNNGVKNNWWLDVKVKPDIYRTSRNKSTKSVSFYTDIDSLQIQLKSGETYNFIVLLNGKDSCYTQIYSEPTIRKYKELSPTTHDTIPFKLSKGNNIVFKVIINKIDTLDLFFDTGSTSVNLIKSIIKNKTHLLQPNNNSVNQVFEKNTVKIGSLKLNDIKVYPISINPNDGHFGWNLFDGRIVEIDYDKRILIVHSSLSKIPENYTKRPIEYINNHLYVNGCFEVNGIKITSRFLFDSGYQRAILVDSVLLSSNKIDFNSIDVIKTTSLKTSFDRVIQTKIFNLNKLSFNNLSLFNIPTQILTQENPTGFHTHILGNELLKRYNTILDFQNHYIYLKPNSLSNLSYVDENKKE